MTRLARFVNLGYRTAYRLAYPPAKLWWRLRRHHGVSVIVWNDHKVLAVRHSYKRGLGLPTGGVIPTEDPMVAGARELEEETGVIIDPKDLIHVLTIQGEFGPRHLYEVRLQFQPVVRFDDREIIYAGFHPPHEVEDPSRRIVAHLRANGHK